MAKRVLLIEDNRTNRELAVYLLESFGYEVSAAVDGEEGVAMAAAEKPDLVVCDIQLPKLDGFGVARRLKSDLELRHIPIVALTALAMVGDRDRVIAAGFDGYVVKPIEPERFGDQVAAFLGPGTRPPPVDPGLPARAPARAPAAGRGQTILFIDDSGVNVDLFCRSLADAGYEIVPCLNGTDVAGMVEKHRPDLVVCDLHMPERNGLAVLTAIRSNPATSKIPFALITSSGWISRDRAVAMRLGADHFISRPIEPELLAAEIADCLAGRKGFSR